MTGAPMPPGSDAVVPVEEAAEIDEKTVRLDVAPRPGAHVRLHGEVFQKGALLLPAGRRLTPADLVLAAAAGRATLRVARPIRAAVLVTGDEIVAPGTRARSRADPEHERTASRLRAAADRRRGHGPRRRARHGGVLVKTLRGALERGDDLLLTTGGVSAGDYDYVARLSRPRAPRSAFTRSRSGRRSRCSSRRKGATLVFGLPGNPVSAAVAFDFLVRPALRSAAGILPPLPLPLPARLAGPVRNKGPRLAFHPASLSLRDGEEIVEPIATKGSHDVLAHARANAFLELPPGSSFAEGRSRSGAPRLSGEHVLKGRRVGVTGLGCLTPIGNGVPAFTEGLRAGRSGVSRITLFDPASLECRSRPR